MNPSNSENWRVYFASAVKIVARNLTRSHLRDKTEYLLDFIRGDPFKQLPPFGRLTGVLKGAYLRRIKAQ